ARVVLLAVFREHAGHHTSAAPALALAECGDLTPLDDIYKLWQPFVDQPGVYTYEPKLVRYLCAHGRRREWDLLYAIAESEIREKEKLPQGPSRVWSTVVGNAMYEKSPYTI